MTTIANNAARVFPVAPGSAPFSVDLSKLAEVLAYLAQIESVPLSGIVWLKNGEEVKVAPEQIEDWRFTGLNNRDFAREYILPNDLISHARTADRASRDT